MADQRQFRKRDYEEIPGQTVFMTGATSCTISGDGTVTVHGVKGFVPPPIVLQRSPPSYNDVTDSRKVANLDGLVQPDEEGAVALPVAGPSSEPDYGNRLSNNPFDEFIIEGYENVTYEPSQWIWV